MLKNDLHGNLQSFSIKQTILIVCSLLCIFAAMLITKSGLITWHTGLPPKPEKETKPLPDIYTGDDSAVIIYTGGVSKDYAVSSDSDSINSPTILINASSELVNQQNSSSFSKNAFPTEDTKSIRDLFPESALSDNVEPTLENLQTLQDFHGW